jgi:excinuclease ABC subunit C
MNRQDLSTYKLPDTPGVYMFMGGRDDTILYIGKATSLRDRVRNYFSTDIATTRGPKVLTMIAEATGLQHIPTDSVLEALILEGNLIRKHQPVYNTDRKDDKSYNHVIITKEEYPRVLLLRSKDLAQISKGSSVRGLSLKDLRYIFGPYPHGTALKQALKLVRKIFPYRDTCTHKQKVTAKGCFNFELGLCPGVCAGAMGKKEYQKRIRHIKLCFEGKKSKILKDLARDMKTYAKKHQFEKAAEARNALFSLEHIQDVSLLSRETMQESFETHTPTLRLEAYDIAHIRGTDTVGVMTVVEDGNAKKSDYRMFRIRNAVAGSDTHALTEVLTRRFKHQEWPTPNIIIMDGGIAQKNVAERVVKSLNLKDISIVSVVKDERHKPSKFLGNKKTIEDNKGGILLGNSEAHRFALQYHHQRRAKSAFQ